MRVAAKSLAPAEVEAAIAREEAGTITIAPEKIRAGDLMDRGMDKLRTVWLVLMSDDKGWLDDGGVQSVAAVLDGAIKDLEPVRNRLQGVDGYGTREIVK